MKYWVNIEEVLTRDVVVDAESEEDAKIKVKHLYRAGKIVLDYSAFIGEPTIMCKHSCNDTVDCKVFD